MRSEKQDLKGRFRSRKLQCQWGRAGGSLWKVTTYYCLAHRYVLADHTALRHLALWRHVYKGECPWVTMKLLTAFQ